ncbi:unnamed protein product [Clonostachys rosea f. rosea IK726]|uniref:Uncharacterized protein n=1 Tax=Clonostachys rosea f. rosea IK726 TaxID=1349383 RepID=A0ACA9U9A2_BIOOC|nr:unnamed protein product [Clonostachys rosea f. rosea IK726]
MPESLGAWEYTKGIKRLRDRQKHHGCTMPGKNSYNRGHNTDTDDNMNVNQKPMMVEDNLLDAHQRGRRRVIIASRYW